MISQFIRMKRIFFFPSVIMYVELKNGKENIKKNQKMHQGYTIATKTHAKIKKWKATSSFYMLIRLFL